MLRIVYANLGYSRDIDGSIGHHVRRLHHHFYTPRDAQLRSLHFVKETLRALRPDLSCFVEIDRGSLTNGFFDQLPELREAHHQTVQIDNKYGADRQYGRVSIARGKSNAFLATAPLDFTVRYLSDGKKRLVYDIDAGGVRVLVAHCSLRYQVRRRQFAELAAWVAERDEPTIVVGDFNTFRGPDELRPLLEVANLLHANASAGPTFRFGPYRAALDTCLVSASLERRCTVAVIDQPFSDHQMLQIDIAGVEASTRAEPAMAVLAHE